MSSLPDFLLEFDLKLFLEYFPEDPSTNPPEVLSGNPAGIPCGNLVGGPSENPFAVFFLRVLKEHILGICRSSFLEFHMSFFLKSFKSFF